MICPALAWSLKPVCVSLISGVSGFQLSGAVSSCESTQADKRMIDIKSPILRRGIVGNMNVLNY